MERLEAETFAWGRETRFLTLLLLVAMVVCFSLVVESSESPQGEIYPFVSVENDLFVVRYIDTNRPDSRGGVYQLVFGKNGNRVGAPTEVPAEKHGLKDRVYRFLKTDPELPEKLRGFILKTGEDFLVTPQSRDVLPYFLAKRDGKYVKEEIGWGSLNRFLIHDAVPMDDKVVVLITEVDVTGGWFSNDFRLISIKRETRKIEQCVSVGTPLSNRSIPDSTQLLCYNGRVFLAWGELYIDGMHLNLSSWNTIDRYLVKEPVSGAIEGSTFLSMAQINGTALLAYHNAKDGYHNSVIKTLILDLRKHFK